MPSEGQIIGGQYKLITLIGKGGMGSVYKAEKVTTHEPLAIKFMKVDYAEDENSLERFKREIEILKNIRHPNVVFIFDWFWPPPGEVEQPYIVMEHLDGEPLVELLKREGKLDPGRAVTIMVQVLDALVAAHEKGIVHRDLGPQNVFLVKNPDDKIRVKLLDFGLAKPQGSTREITKVGTVIGRVTYAAPEHFLAKPTDERSDIFSCGMMMMRMVTGRLPYKETRIERLWIERRKDSGDPTEYPPARSFAPDLPKFVDDIITRAIRKNPDERYQHAYEMQGELMEVEVELESSDDAGALESMDGDEPTEVYMPRHAENMDEFFRQLEKKKEKKEKEKEEEGETVETKRRLPAAAGRAGEEGMDGDVKSIDVQGSVESEVRMAAFRPFLTRLFSDRRLLVPVLIGLLAVLGLAVTAVVLLTMGQGRRQRAAEKAQEMVPAISAGQAVVEEAPPPPEKDSGLVSLTVRGAPPGAIAKVGDSVLEGEPLTADVQPIDTPVTLEVYAEGYQPYTATVTLNTDLDIKVAMISLKDPAAAGEEPGVPAAGKKVAEEGQVKTGKKKKPVKRPVTKKSTVKMEKKLGTSIITDYED
jgi:serine/threonine protein kinase